MLSSGGISEDLIYISKVIVGKIKGSLAHINIIASIFFGGVSGSSVADVASLGPVLIPAMKKQGYNAEFSATLTAASSIIGNVIPPSILMIVYGAIVQTSIAALFLAGILPGILIGLVQMLFSYFYAKKNKIDDQNIEDLLIEYGEVSKFVLIRKAIFKSITPVSIFLIVIGGLTLGVFTPTEAAGVAVIYLAAVLFIFYDKRSFNFYLKNAKTTALATGQIFFLIMAATLFSWVLTFFQVLHPLIEVLKDTTGFPPEVFLIVISLIYILLGTFMEANSIVLIVVPLVLPIVQLLKIDFIVFGIITVICTRVGSITPPYGLCSIMAADIAGTKMHKMTKYILIFVLLFIVNILVCIFIPDVILFLPKLLLPKAWIGR
jgi:tripartite ATP-independent transporter DctM subunit